MKCRIALTCVLVLLICGDVFAIGRRRRKSNTYRSSGPSHLYVGTDQERCYAEAQYMSQNRIFAHVGGLIGHFEGWGYGGPNCSTCTPRNGMTLTGDASVGGFRVRSWR